MFLIACPSNEGRKATDLYLLTSVSSLGRQIEILFVIFGCSSPGKTVSDFDPRCLSSTLWAMAELGYQPQTSLLDKFQNRVEELIIGRRFQDGRQEFADVNISQTLWAFSKLQYMPRPSFIIIIERQSEYLLCKGSFEALALASTVKSFASLGVRPGENFVTALHAAAIKMRNRFSGQGLADVIWGFCMMEVRRQAVS